jgi:hypothetical protein
MPAHRRLGFEILKSNYRKESCFVDKNLVANAKGNKLQ